MTAVTGAIATLSTTAFAAPATSPPKDPGSPAATAPVAAAEVKAEGESPNAKVDDSRFGEIGKGAPDPGSESTPIAAGISATNIGRVTYAGLRVDVPVYQSWSLVPQAALIRVGPFGTETKTAVNTYLGMGVATRFLPSWSFELDAIYGPQGNNIGSFGTEASVGKEVGADWEHDVPPVMELEFVGSARRFYWANGLGPAGSNVVQFYLEAKAAVNLTRAFTATPKAMVFAYSKALDDAGGERLGSVGVLARVGSYAPGALFGLELAYAIGIVSPFVSADEISYAAGIGTGTELLGGVKLRLLGNHGRVLLGGGVLLNRASGPLVDPADNLRTVPVLTGEVEWSF
ncbi:MAG: hypothetical protein NVSMB1_09220 [Polyangiales bacterium]